MIRLRKILFPTDFSNCAGQAFNYAVFFAQKYDADLHILHAVVPFDKYSHFSIFQLNELEEIQKKISKRAEVEMNQLIEFIKKSELGVHTVNREGNSEADVILDYSNAKDIDLIVMGTHGRRGIGHLFLGSAAEEVVRLSKCPVITVREQKQPKPIPKLTSILVPIDYSEHSKKSLKYAKEISIAYGAKLQVIHIIEETIDPAFSITGKSSIFDLVPDIEVISKKKIEGLIKDTIGAETKTEIYTMGGKPAADIINFAELKLSDLIVIATHGLTGIEHFLVGSVTEKVVRMASCPVFTIKAFGKSLINQSKK